VNSCRDNEICPQCGKVSKQQIRKGGLYYVHKDKGKGERKKYCKAGTVLNECELKKHKKGREVVLFIEMDMAKFRGLE